MLPPDGAQPMAVPDYRQELMESLSTARQTALHSISRAQKKYKKQYDRKSDSYQYCIGDWVLIRYPSEETGRFRKLSRPWHGPYRITACDDTGVSAVKVYFPREDAVKVHQTRVKPCPDGLLAGYYWYGNKRKGPGRPPKWVEKILSATDEEDANGPQEEPIADTESQEEPESSMASIADTESSVVSMDPELTESETTKSESEQVNSRVSNRYSLRRSRKPPERLH